MKNPTWNPVIIGNMSGYTVVLSFEEEYENARDHFIKQCGWSTEEYKTISSYYFFCSKVSVYLGNIEVGNNYLGMNCYKNKKQVLGEWRAPIDFNNNLNSVVSKSMLGGYIPQMIEDAIEEAKINFEGKPTLTSKY